MNQTIFNLLNRLWGHVNKRRRVQFLFLVVLMVFSSFAEVISIGAVLPFLAVLVAPEKFYENEKFEFFIDYLSITEPAELLLPFTSVFILAIIISNSMRLLLLWVNTRLSFATGADLGIGIYRRTLYQPYSSQVNLNSSEIISGISTKADGVIYQTIVPALFIINAFFVLTAILIALITIDPKIAIISFGGFGFIYFTIIWGTRKRLKNGSRLIADMSTKVIKSLQEGLGGIRDVLIDGSQSTYSKIYRSADLPLRHAQGNMMFIAHSPRFLMEAIGMILISVLAYTLTTNDSANSSAIPLLGALALGAQRLLPMMQQAYASWTSIQGFSSSLLDTLELLDQPLPDFADNPETHIMSFNKKINLKRIDFYYKNENQYVLKNINLEIKKGARVGFIGKTGSGKSTLLDIIMGLLSPTNGTIEIDGVELSIDNFRSWQTNIAHVPQAIYLTDNSIEKNIAFGVPTEKIDLNRVKSAAKQAQIASIIESWPMQYKTRVGERGIQLSGGQRQRIGIARALYKNAEVIIFDEATSALDDLTEKEVMSAIENLSNNITLLLVAHRLTTLKNCTHIVKLNNGEISQIGDYEELIS
jgi:ATP-binding cassette, subfamily B, bacterial PglK